MFFYSCMLLNIINCISNINLTIKISPPATLLQIALSIPQTGSLQFVTKKLITMKLSKSLLQAMVMAVTVASISSCEKPAPVKEESSRQKPKTDSAYVSCPGCGMG
jgi:hypothetical protein